MKDVRNCGLMNDQAKLSLRMGSGTTIVKVCVIGHDYPGRRTAIRFEADRNDS